MTEKTAGSSSKPRMAICYDFDKTLSPDDMQTFTLIPSFGIDKQEFWDASTKLAKENLMENNLAWMYQLIRYSEFNGKSLKREYFRQIGSDVKLNKGVKTWYTHYYLDRFCYSIGKLFIIPQKHKSYRCSMDRY